MAGAFQSTAFQNNAFQTDGSTPVVVPPIVGGGWVRHRGEHGVINQFTRKRWEELKAAWRAQEELAKRAEDETNAKRKASIAKAADDAAQALETISRSEERAAIDLAAVTRAMEAAASAERTAKIIAQVKKIEAFAANLADEDDEEAAALLLLN